MGKECAVWRDNGCLFHCFSSVAQVLFWREQVMEDVLLGRCWHTWVQAAGDTSLFFPVPHRL